MKTRDILAGQEANERAIEEFKKTLPVYSLEEKRKIAEKLLFLDQTEEYESYEPDSFYQYYCLNFHSVKEDGIQWEIYDRYARWADEYFFTTFEALDADKPLDQYLAEQKARKEAEMRLEKEWDRKTYERLKAKFEGNDG